MLRVLQQFILTTLFAVFASQASAMFIQPDWFDPTEPGVGTNRFSYSHNDPVNLSDPSGNSTVVTEDPDNEGEFFVEDVTDDDDLGIYVKDDELPEEEWEKIGRTHAWDSFRSPDTGKPVGKIYMGQSIDQYYIDKAKQATTESKFTVARKSRPGKEYDLKATYPGHENKSYHGFLLDGEYVSLREAGNMLAGQNAAALGVPWTDFQQSAGRLHNSNVVTFPMRQLVGTVFGTAPNWGENDYQRTRSFHGYMRGTLMAHPSHPR